MLTNNEIGVSNLLEKIDGLRTMLSREQLNSGKLNHMALSGRTLARDAQAVIEARAGSSVEELAARILQLVTEYNYRQSRIDAIYTEKSEELEKKLKAE